MKQTKAQRAVLKYLKKNYPKVYARISDIRIVNGTNLWSVFKNDSFVNLMRSVTPFLDKFDLKPKVRLLYIVKGIEKNFCVIHVANHSHLDRLEILEDCLLELKDSVRQSVLCLTKTLNKNPQTHTLQEQGTSTQHRIQNQDY